MMFDNLVKVLIFCYFNIIANCDGFFTVNVPSVNYKDKFNNHASVSNSTPINLEEYPGSACTRPCTASAKPKICYYDWTIEHYSAMGSACKDCSAGVQEDCFHHQCITADGVEKGVMSINRLVPGPSIQVCKGDEIIVDVHNEAHGTAVTIHWHGIHQKNTPYMDGVPFVTQCPISFGNTFRYKFSAEKAGTFLYHSHSGHHKSNGQYGAIVVRQPIADDLNSQYYHFDISKHVILAADWLHFYAENYVPGHPKKFLQISSVVMNGRGRHFDESLKTHKTAPLAFFRVKKGGKYRFRFINGASLACPFQLQVEKHQLQVIGSDGYSVRPLFVDTIFSLSGERFDFVIDANQKSGLYWIRLRATGSCANQNIETFAVLSYSKKSRKNDTNLAFPSRKLPKFKHPYDIGMSLNSPDKTCSHGVIKNCVAISDLQSYPNVDENTEIAQAHPDEWVYLTFNTHIIDNDLVFAENSHFHFMNIINNVNIIGTVNEISFVSSSFPLLTQSDEIDEKLTFCNADNLPTQCQNKSYCFCLHRQKVKLNSIISMRISDESPGGLNSSVNHPFHMHGHQFLVLDMGQQPQKDSQANNSYPPFKDTVTVPSQGFVIIKFRANNPGFWFLHCHFEWHLGIGMGMVLQVGEIDEMVKPPSNFPRCGNYQPDFSEDNNINLNV